MDKRSEATTLHPLSKGGLIFRPQGEKWGIFRDIFDIWKNLNFGREALLSSATKMGYPAKSG